jgi:hypothetical protein
MRNQLDRAALALAAPHALPEYMAMPPVVGPACLFQHAPLAELLPGQVGMGVKSHYFSPGRRRCGLRSTVTIEAET